MSAACSENSETTGREARGHAAHLGDAESIFWCLAQNQRWMGQEGPSEVEGVRVGGGGGGCGRPVRS